MIPAQALNQERPDPMTLDTIPAPKMGDRFTNKQRGTRTMKVVALCAVTERAHMINESNGRLSWVQFDALMHGAEWKRAEA